MATLTYRDAVGRALQDSLRADPRLILIGQNIAGMNGSPQSFAKDERQIFVETANFISNKSLIEFRKRNCLHAVAIDDG